MMHLFVIVNKVLVKTFYKDNAGFFLVLTGLCFGFLRKADHIALAQFFVSSVYVFMIPASLWLLYTIKVILYNRDAVALQQNTFLSSFIFLPTGSKIILLLAAAMIQLLPIIAYGLFLIKMASAINLSQSKSDPHELNIVCIIIALLFSLVSIVVFSANRNLLYATTERQITFIKRIFDSRFTKPHLQFFIEWVIRTRTAIFFGAKIFAAAVIIGISRFYLFDDYDVRLMALGVLLAMTANIGLIFQFHRFENYHFQWLKNLPLTLIQKIVFFLITFMMICLPEWIVLLRFFPSQLSLFNYAELFIFGNSLILLAYTSLFIHHIPFEKLTHYMFYCFMVFFVTYSF